MKIRALGLALACLTFSACTESGASIAATYVADTAAAAGAATAPVAAEAPTITLNADGTFVGSEGRMTVKGTYKVDGETITFTATEKNGAKLEPHEVTSGTIRDGKIHYKAPGKSVEVILKRK